MSDVFRCDDSYSNHAALLMGKGKQIIQLALFSTVIIVWDYIDVFIVEKHMDH